MKITTLIFLLLGVAVIVVSAYFAKKAKHKRHVADPAPTDFFPYNVNSPSKEFDLKKKLREISDLSYDPASNSIWAVADEKGVLHRIHLPEGEPVDHFKFGKNGDYEGVEAIGDTLYAMESNGRITRILNATSDSPETEIFENPSLEDNDIEAFMYDPNLRKLVIGIKTPKESKDARAFYAFDPVTAQLDEQPLFVISLSDIQAFLRKNGLEGDYYHRWLKKKADMPSPSASAIQPGTGHYFILCSVGKTLLVTQPNGEILQVVALDEDLHNQPEGLSFTPDGTMYISNEAGGGAAKLYAYSMIGAGK